MEDFNLNYIINKRKEINKCIFNLVFFFALLITTLLSIKRLKLFIEMYESFSKFFNIFGIEFYFVSLTLLIIFFISMIVLIIYHDHNNKEWNSLLKNIFDKLDIFIFFLKCFSILLFIILFFINPCTISGKSMYSTFDDGEKIICSDFMYEPKRGDVITFDSSNYTNNKTFYIKRIIAVEGDKLSYDQVTTTFYVNGKKEKRQNVYYDEFLVLVNGLTLQSDEEYEFGYYVIPKNEIVVLGDNRLNSLDSRKFGRIKEKDVFGKVIFRLYPLNKMKIYF